MPETMLQGTVVRGIGSFYTVRTRDGAEYTLRAQKKIRRMRISPLPGDEVLFLPPGDGEQGWIGSVLPRKTLCLRPPVANVETLVVVLAPEPEPDLLLTDRQTARAYAQGMKVLLAANKCDADGGELARRLTEEYASSGVRVFPVSALEGTGLEPLKEAMRGSLCCFSGQSGAGKSTLINALLDLNRETGGLSRKIARGKNTTRSAELLEKDGIRVMDSAGFSLLEPEKDLPPEELKNRYPEFLPYEGKCRFRQCLHDSEPGCAVAEAVRNGAVHPARWRRYRGLLAETRENWKNRYE